MHKIALITGVTGQDGAYLSRLLLKKGYIVHGIKRRSSSFNTQRIDKIIDHPNFFLHFGDITDSTNIIRLIKEIKPNEIYNLAAQSHVKVSFETPEYTANSDALGTLRILEAIRILEIQKTCKFYQASTSELFGKVQSTPQNESTPFYPRSPYAVAKLYAYWIVRNYREAYGIFSVNGILFNHESPVRGETFVTRKITLAVARIYHGKLDKLQVGNLDAKRDWGHARDYVEGMWRMLQHEVADDFVLATGSTHSVREFIELAFEHIGITITWSGQGINEIGINNATGQTLVSVDKKYFRPTEVDLLLGDSSKAHQTLNWKHTTNFSQLVKEMVDFDINAMTNAHYDVSLDTLANL